MIIKIRTYLLEQSQDDEKWKTYPEGVSFINTALIGCASGILRATDDDETEDYNNHAVNLVKIEFMSEEVSSVLVKSMEFERKIMEAMNNELQVQQKKADRFAQY